MKLDLPRETGRAGWKLDRMAITNAITELDIKYPVIMRMRWYKQHRHSGWISYGNHRIGEGPCHVIRLNDSIARYLINETIWHELVHAMQAERFQANNPEYELKDWYEQAYKVARGIHGETYIGNHYEIEARRIAYASQERWLVIEP